MNHSYYPRRGTVLFALIYFVHLQFALAQWSSGPGKKDDVGSDAVAAGTLTFIGRSEPATFYLACAGDMPAVGHYLRLRAFAAPMPGLPQTPDAFKMTRVLTGSKAGDMPVAVQDVVNTGQFLVFLFQTQDEEINRMLQTNDQQKATLSYPFTTRLGNGAFTLPIPPAGPPLTAVTTACKFTPTIHVAVSPQLVSEYIEILQQFQAIAPGAKTPASLSSKLESLKQSSRGTPLETDFLTDDLPAYISSEKKPSDALPRKKCLSQMVTNAKASKFKLPVACNDILIMGN